MNISQNVIYYIIIIIKFKVLFNNNYIKVRNELDKQRFDENI